MSDRRYEDADMDREKQRKRTGLWGALSEIVNNTEVLMQKIVFDEENNRFVFEFMGKKYELKECEESPILDKVEEGDGQT